MSVPASPSRRRTAQTRPKPAVPLALLLVVTAGCAAAIVTAPTGARTWASALAATAWAVSAGTVVIAFELLRRTHRAADARGRELAGATTRLNQLTAEISHLSNVTFRALSKRVLEGTGADEALAALAPAGDPQLSNLVRSHAAVVEDLRRRQEQLESELRQKDDELRRMSADAAHLTEHTLPAAVERLRDGTSAQTVLAEVDWPHSSALRAPTELYLRELARSERRSAAGQAASAKALSRVQAKTVSMLADLREMQERHGEEVFGDLLRLDHTSSQLGLLTDRLSLLMGGRSSRAWNRPIVLESILRGALGRIAAYQRVRTHCASTAAISGYAAEGVMHLLAELMDNAANFSPPIDEVHVYVEERTSGIVVTIEDSGLKMSDAAMRHAERAVSGE